MSITIGRLTIARSVKNTAVIGYTCLGICGIAQWGHTLLSGNAQGVSPIFLAVYTLGLILLQVSFRLQNLGPFYEIGNGLGLVNALMMLGAWWWVGGAK